MPRPNLIVSAINLGVGNEITRQSNCRRGDEAAAATDGRSAAALRLDCNDRSGDQTAPGTIDPGVEHEITSHDPHALTPHLQTCQHPRMDSSRYMFGYVIAVARQHALRDRKSTPGGRNYGPSRENATIGGEEGFLYFWNTLFPKGYKKRKNCLKYLSSYKIFMVFWCLGNR
jgi:hypothetical protein